MNENGCDCSHMHISRMRIEKGVGEIIDEWWECDSCGEMFVPVGSIFTRIQAFHDVCERENYTEHSSHTGDAWDILMWIKNICNPRRYKQ